MKAVAYKAAADSRPTEDDPLNLAWWYRLPKAVKRCVDTRVAGRVKYCIENGKRFTPLDRTCKGCGVDITNEHRARQRCRPCSEKHTVNERRLRMAQMSKVRKDDK